MSEFKNILTEWNTATKINGHC